MSELEKLFRAEGRMGELEKLFWAWRVKRMQRKMREIGNRRAFVAHPDLHLWIQGIFQVGWRRLVKRGQARGFLVVQMGWIVATLRW